MLRALLLALVGSAAFAAVYLLMPWQSAQDLEDAEESVSVAPFDPAPVEFALRPGDSAGETPSPESVLTQIRDVTPTNMTAAPAADEPPARVAPEDGADSSGETRMERLYNPIIVSAGRIKVHGREIRLAGIEAPVFAERCGEGAAAWPCGRMARAALRRFIRGRAVECEIPAGDDTLPDPARCEVGGADIAAWLVEQGWARSSAGAAESYAKIEAAAREEKLGLWGDGRPDAQPEALAAGG
jgi:endonuclease YncB( thermonuclease family)